MQQTAFLLAARAERGPVDPLQRARDARDEPGDPSDPDEKAANLLARGYSPGQQARLSQELAEAEAELAGLRETEAKAEARRSRARREHAAGRVDAWGMQAMLDGEEADPGRMAFLERRIATRRQELADTAAMIGPRQEPADPLEAASRHAHDVFVQATRAKMAAAAAGRPAPRPFGSISRGAAVRGEQPPCEACAAVGATPDESFWIHHLDADGRPVSAEAELASGQEAGRGSQYGDVIAR
jgi:hypothetical protein